MTTLIIHNHSDEAAYFTFIELDSSVPLAELLVKNFHQSVEHGPLFRTWSIIQRHLKNHP